MRTFWQLVVGLASALAMTFFVFGAVALSISEAGISTASAQETLVPTTPTSPSRPTASPTLVESTSEQAAGETVTLAVTNTPSVTPSMTPTFTCQFPKGWVPYEVQTGDSLDSLALQAGVTSADLQKANCLDSTGLKSGSILYLPRELPTETVPATATSLAASATLTPRTCQVPYGWIKYTVRSGDTLFRIAQNYGVSLSDLMFANCLTGTLIQPGDRLYVPNTPTLTPSPTPTREEKHPTDNPVVMPSPTPSSTSTDTPVPVTPSPAATDTTAPTVAPTVDATTDLTPKP